jgi:hypothetical protein
MSITRKIVMTAAALTLGAGIGAASTLTANAATGDCGHGCIDLYSLAFGTAAPIPTYVIDLPSHPFQTVPYVTLARASGANQAEDFAVSEEGTVHDFVLAGIIASGMDTKAYTGLNVVQFEYAPKGAPSGNCVAVPAAPGSGTALTLRPCGVDARTTWIIDPQSPNQVLGGALISGATNRNFQHPYAMTVTVPGLPLVTEPLQLGAPARVLDHQLWNAYVGVLPTPKPAA